MTRVTLCLRFPTCVNLKGKIKRYKFQKPFLNSLFRAENHKNNHTSVMQYLQLWTQTEALTNLNSFQNEILNLLW